jgi:sec-independent protein translocase protein TatA
MPGNVGLTEIVIVLVIALLVFGPKKLPEMGRGLGRGMREFKTSLTTDTRDDDDAPDTRREAPVQELPPAAPPPTSAAVPPVPTETARPPGAGTPR